MAFHTPSDQTFHCQFVETRVHRPSDPHVDGLFGQKLANISGNTTKPLFKSVHKVNATVIKRSLALHKRSTGSSKQKI